MSKLSEYFGEDKFDDRFAYVHALSHNNYAAQAVTDGGHTVISAGCCFLQKNGQR